MNVKSVFGACLAVGILASAASAEVPELINYQGRLVDGANLVTGSAVMEFRFFTNDVGGVRLYADTQTVSVIDGLYSAMIGASNTAANALRSLMLRDPLYLEVVIDGTTLAPRERMLSVGRALNVKDVFIDDDRVAVGVSTEVGFNAVSVGGRTLATDFGTTLGDGASASNAVAVGYESISRRFSVAVGAEAEATDYATALGDGAYAVGTNLALGYAASALGGLNRIAIGARVNNIVDDSARIRGDLYLDGASSILYRTNFGSGVWMSYGDGYLASTGGVMTGPLTIDAGAGPDLIIGSSGTDVMIGKSANGQSFGVAVGHTANANNSGAAVGYLANGANSGAALGIAANGFSQGVALGNSANAYSNSVAVGFGAVARSNAVAVGANANGDWFSVAVGESANGYRGGVAVGRIANGVVAGTALGLGADGHDRGTAVGWGAGAFSNGVAVGYGAAGRERGVGIGDGAEGQTNNVAVGYDSRARWSSVAMGYDAAAISMDVAIGHLANADGGDVVIGYHATGTVGAVIVGSAARGRNNGIAVGYGANGEYYGIAIGTSARASGGAVSIGYSTRILTNGTAIGYRANGENYGTALGYEANGFDYSVALGYRATSRYVSVAAGLASYASNHSVAVGWGASARDNSVALGYDAEASHYNTAVGYRTAAASGSNRVSIGRYVINDTDNSARMRGTLYMDGSAAGFYHRPTFGSGGWTWKAFVIDHPLDPQNWLLRHACMESPTVWNVYAGTAKLNGAGEAVVELPAYFEALNKNPQYMLTPVGSQMNLFVKEEIADNAFVIAGGTPGGKVCWEVKAERNDVALRENPLVVEQEKAIPGLLYR